MQSYVSSFRIAETGFIPKHKTECIFFSFPNYAQTFCFEIFLLLAIAGLNIDRYQGKQINHLEIFHSPFFFVRKLYKSQNFKKCT